MKKHFSILCLFIFQYVCLEGQSLGDYRTIGSGNWSNSSLWQTYNGATWVTSAVPDASAITKKITISSGNTITATSALSGSTGGILEIASTGVLNMGSYSISGPGATGKFPGLIINGILNTSSFVNSTVFNLNSGGRFNTSFYAPRGWWSSNYSPTLASLILDGEIEFSNSSYQVVPGYSYNNVLCSGGLKVLFDDTEIRGFLTINSGASFVLSLWRLTFSGSNLTNNGNIDGSDSYLDFNGTVQTLSGSGTFGSAFEELNVLGSASVLLSNPNVISTRLLNINSGSTFTISPTSKVDVLSSLITGNGLILKASQIPPYTNASLNVSASATVTGNTNVELYLTGGQNADNTYKWHYISSPFTSLAATNFTTITSNIAKYDESLVTTDQTAGWVKSNGYVYSTGGTTTGFGGLISGKGYNHYFSDAHLYTLTGVLKTTSTSSVITYNSNQSYPDYPNSQGYNLLGNPFSCSLNWDAIDDYLPAGVGWGIYFTTGDGKFASWVNGIGTGGTSSVTASGSIPPMQGFFVKTSTEATISFLEAAKIHSAQSRYKGESSIPLIRLKIENSSESDDAVIRFDDKATNGVDDAFDAFKFSKTGGAVGIWSSNGTNDFSINGIAFPDPQSLTEIPIGINSKASESIKISGVQIEGLESYDLTLTDKLNNYSINLKTTPNMTINAPGGIVSNRFVLKIGNIATGISDERINKKDFNVFASFSQLNIQTFGDSWIGKKGNIKVYDMTGRAIFQIDNNSFSRDALIQIPVNNYKGLFIVEIRSGILRFTDKVLIN